MAHDYDLLAIGCGPAGQKAAIQAAKLGRRAAVVERRQLGGVCVITGTIPSKTLREAVLHLTGFTQRGVYGQSYRVKEEITAEDLRSRYLDVIRRETDVIRDQLTRNHVAILEGTAGFVDPHTVSVARADGSERKVSAEYIVVGTGTRPARPPTVAFDDRAIFDSDGLFKIERIPGSFVVVGGGVVGIEYASIFAALGTKVTVVDKRRRILEFCDDEIIEGLQHHLRDLGLTLRLGEEVTAVNSLEEGALVELASGKRIAAEAVLYSAGREGATDDLDLANAGLEADDRGRIKVGENYRTVVPHIYAVGDVIGFPSLAATAMEQGRIAALDAFGQAVHSAAGLLPIGIYTIPEISFVGKTEGELTEAGVAYEVGISRYRELARGAILGESHGMLKILVSPENRRLLGVHVLGTGATELVHIGQAVMGNEGTLDYLLNSVFNYPTLAEAYKVAALDAQNKLHAVSRLGPE
ncbi:MAG TPA: Si-specific NAD(P)(+) transhydrogenase [Actinomycetota bacterium]|jgi:NAD(P) transhydrogenase|nr:Si-specific NAD(P)(+) transhydrogenase [Actinomycetota bacterium]